MALLLLATKAPAPHTLHWLDVLVVAIFTLGIVAVVLIPFTIDVVASHRTFAKMAMAEPAIAARADEPHGVQGLARASMAFAVIVVVGFALAYILIARPLTDNKAVSSNILVALTTTLASITAFYFGSRLSSQAHREATDAAAAKVGATPTAKLLTVTITSPADGATYKQNDNVIADYSCTPSAGAEITTITGTVPAGSPIDTSQLGQQTFTVSAADTARQTAEVTSTYTVEAP